MLLIVVTYLCVTRVLYSLWKIHQNTYNQLTNVSSPYLYYDFLNGAANRISAEKHIAKCCVDRDKLEQWVNTYPAPHCTGGKSWTAGS